MSLIHTCEINRVNPFDYLMALQQHAAAVAKAPEMWLPWNFQQTITAAATADSPVSSARPHGTREIPSGCGFFALRKLTEATRWGGGWALVAENAAGPKAAA